MKFLDVLGVLLLKAIAKFLRALPPRTALKFGRFFGRIVFFLSSRKRVAYADLKHAFGNRFTEKERWKVARGIFEHFGQVGVEILRFPKLDLKEIEKSVTIHHKERFDRLIAQDRGVILLTAHLGNWEYLQIVSCLLGKPIHVLAREQKHTLLNQYLNKMRESHGSNSIRRGMGVRDLMRGLRRKELIGLLGDQDAGKYEGLILPFFGRKTTVPTGPFDLAFRTGAPVLPCFMMRTDQERHEIFVGEPIDFGKPENEAKRKEALQDGLMQYLKTLEKNIEQFPEQWLWTTKRWKYSWTKRVLILSDGKAGHVKQSRTVALGFQDVKSQHTRPGMDYPTQEIEVRYKSGLHRHLFVWFTLLMRPWAQGRLRLLKFFFEEESFKAIMNARADFVISTGSSLVPLNLWLAKDCRAKSLVIMKPPFPFNLFGFDLVVVPAHDRGHLPKHTLRLLLSPSRSEPTQLEKDTEALATTLRNPSSVQFSIFLGGPTRRYSMELKDIEDLFLTLRRVSKREGDYLVTTSRRTPDEISSFLKKNVALDESCQMVVIAKEDSRSEVMGGMMGLADILIVTEDSVSMISEAVSSGKKVIVLDLKPDALPTKHRRFKEILAKESAVSLATPQNLEQVILNLQNQMAPAVAAQESELLRKRLEAML